MAIELLTNLACRNATSEGKVIRKLSDGGGLYLWIYADGKKYWRLRYWVNKVEKSLSLGVYPVVTLAKARKLTTEIREKLQNKLDPSQERKAEKLQSKQAAANSLEAVAIEWHQKRLHTWVKSHADDVKRRLEVNIFPALGKRPIAEIEAPELLQAIQVIEKRGSYDLAHRVLQVCGQVFRYGIATGRCSRNLSADLRGALTPHKKQHQAAVHQDDLPELLRAISAYEQTGDKQTRIALQLLAHTFVRTSELINAQWEEFDLDNALWVIHAKRMKMKTEHVVPLSPQSIKLLAELKTVSLSDRYLFAGRNRDKPISNNTLLFALYRLGYKGKMTGHGFRAVASTALNEKGFRADVIERQLAHCERNEVRGAYNRAEYLPERIKMMAWWSEYIQALEAGAKIISLGKVAK